MPKPDLHPHPYGVLFSVRSGPGVVFGRHAIEPAIVPGRFADFTVDQSQHANPDKPDSDVPGTDNSRADKSRADKSWANQPDEPGADDSWRSAAAHIANFAFQRANPKWRTADGLSESKHQPVAVNNLTGHVSVSDTPEEVIRSK